MVMKKLLLASAVVLQCAAALAQNFDNTFWTNGFCSFEATQSGDKIDFFGSAALGDTGYDFTLIKTGRNTFVTQNGGSYIFGRTVEYRTIDNGDDGLIELLIAYDDKKSMSNVFYRYGGSIEDLLVSNFLMLLEGTYTDAAGKEYVIENSSVNGVGFEVYTDEDGRANNIKYKNKYYKVVFSDTGINIYNARHENGMVFGDVFVKTTLHKKLRKKTQQSGNLTGRWQYTSTQIVNEDMLMYFRDKTQLRLMRNEIFARRGYIFLSPDLKTHFGKMSWYKPVSDNSKIHFSDLENLNINIIKKCETAYPADFYIKIEKGL